MADNRHIDKGVAISNGLMFDDQLSEIDPKILYIILSRSKIEHGTANIRSTNKRLDPLNIVNQQPLVEHVTADLLKPDVGHSRITNLGNVQPKANIDLKRRIKEALVWMLLQVNPRMTDSQIKAKFTTFDRLNIHFILDELNTTLGVRDDTKLVTEFTTNKYLLESVTVKDLENLFQAVVPAYLDLSRIIHPDTDILGAHRTEITITGGTFLTRASAAKIGVSCRPDGVQEDC